MNRNQDNPDAEVHEYGDRRICKHFLLGCCPHDVFRQTKIDLVGSGVRCWGLGLWLYIAGGDSRLLPLLPTLCVVALGFGFVVILGGRGRLLSILL